MTPIEKASDDAATSSNYESVVYMKASEVCELLRVKPQTVYAYVSRGWIRRIRSEQHRFFLYLREDVERLGARQRGRAEKGPLKGSAPHWSAPVVQTSITDLTPHGPSYRGRNAVDLARGHYRFENVAELLWTGVWNNVPLAWIPAQLSPEQKRLFKAMSPRKPKDASPNDLLQYFSVLMLSLAVGPSASDDIRDGTTVACARSALWLLASVIAELCPSARIVIPTDQKSLALHLATAFGLAASEGHRNAINTILVLLADHQLTPQTVAARLAASSGASLFHCLNSALSVHSSSRVRRSCDRIEDLLSNSTDSTEFSRELNALRGLGSHASNLDSALYPHGDPRADLMLQLAEHHAGQRSDGEYLLKYINQLQVDNLQPNVEAGLVLLCYALGMPRRAAGALLAVARCAGWIGHIIEQRTAGLMLRPRIRYRG
ncbi:MAG: citrate synthase [Pigmentiphaga sp.]